MSRLDPERAKEPTPKRMEYALVQLDKAGILEFECTDKTIKFNHKGHTVTLYAFSGWFTGKSIKDGRGIDNLLNQLKSV